MQANSGGVQPYLRTVSLCKFAAVRVPVQQQAVRRHRRPHPPRPPHVSEPSSQPELVLQSINAIEGVREHVSVY